MLISLNINDHTGAGIADASGEMMLFGQTVDKGSEVRPLARNLKLSR